MKRRIVDILKERNGGITEKDGDIFLYYPIQDGDKIKTIKVDVTTNVTEIEDTWRVVRLPLYLSAALTKCVSIKMICLPSQASEYRQWVFTNILQRLLVEHLKPKGGVVIWQEKDGKSVKICGLCGVY